MLVSSQLSPGLEHIVSGVFAVPANLLNSVSTWHLPRVSTKLAQRSVPFGGMELRDANTVPGHNVSPAFLSLNLSALCPEFEVKYSTTFAGCSPGWIEKVWVSAMFFYGGEGSAYCVLPPALFTYMEKVLHILLVEYFYLSSKRSFKTCQRLWKE